MIKAPAGKVCFFAGALHFLKINHCMELQTSLAYHIFRITIYNKMEYQIADGNIYSLFLLQFLESRCSKVIFFGIYNKLE